MTKTGKRLTIFLGLIVLVGALYGIYWFLYARFYVTVTDAYVAGNQNSITSQVSGTIKELNMEDTQVVKEGDIVAVIDDSDYKIALAEAEANLAGVVREYETLLYAVVEAEKVVDSEKSNYNTIKITNERDQRAYANGLISEQELDDSNNNLMVANANLAKAYASLESAKTKVGRTNLYSYPQFLMAVEKYNMAYLNLLRTKVYSPISGVLAKKSAYIGQQIEQNQELVSVVDLEGIWVTANIKETSMNGIEIGTKVSLSSDYNGKIYEGYVQGISAGSGSALSLLPAQNATGNWVKIVQRVPVRIFIKKESIEKNGAIPIGTSIVATIDLREKTDKVESFEIKNSNLYFLEKTEINKKIKQIVDDNLFRKEE
jgi:membrane fusion protein (multidrug efflux system)